MTERPHGKKIPFSEGNQEDDVPFSTGGICYISSQEGTYLAQW